MKDQWRGERVLRALLLLIPCVTLWLRTTGDGRGAFEVLFFDVGQGDAALVRWGRRSLLVDAGGAYGNWSAGSHVLLPELTRSGVLSLSWALLSHPDQDHGGGFRSLLAELPPVVFLWSAAGGPSPPGKERLLSEIEESLKDRGSVSRRFPRPVSWVADGVRIHLIPVFGRSSNNQSLVLLLEGSGCRFLFAGDLEREGEKRLLSRLTGPVDVLKVGHHGGRTSSTPAFLKRLRPQWAVISSGAGNPYGHPHAPVLRRLRGFGARVLRTDFHGYIRFQVKPGGRLHCRDAHGNCGIRPCGRRVPEVPPPENAGNG